MVMSKSKKNILVVDDEPMWLDILSTELKAAGHHVKQASSGAEALSTLASYKPDLIFTDLRMPDMNGFELVEEIKKNPAVASTPVVFLSAIDDFHAKKVARDLGAVDFLPKPFDRSDVTDLLAKYLSS